MAVAALTSLTWGLTGIFVRLLPSFSPLAITAGRLMIGLAAVLPVFILLRDRRRGLIAALQHPVAYVLAVLMAGYYLLATAAFQLAPVAEVALLISTTPLFVLALRWVRGTLPARSEIGGSLLALGGMALILVPKMSFSGEAAVQHFYGDLWALCSAVLAAFYASIYRVLSERGRAPDASGVSVLTFVIGSVILILALALTPGSSGWSGSSGLDGTALWVLLGLGVLSTAIPTLGFAIASRRLPPMVTATILLFVPVFAGLFAYVLLGETISLLFIAGCFLVLGGVAMILRQSPAGPSNT